MDCCFSCVFGQEIVSAVFNVFSFCQTTEKLLSEGLSSQILSIFLTTSTNVSCHNFLMFLLNVSLVHSMFSQFFIFILHRSPQCFNTQMLHFSMFSIFIPSAFIIFHKFYINIPMFHRKNIQYQKTRCFPARFPCIFLIDFLQFSQ
jgi:hypothetical protein